MQHGYARVSSDGQDTAMQVAALRRAGVRHIVSEARSGASLEGRLLGELLDKLKPGDVLVVYKLDRLARSLTDLLAVLRRIDAAGASVRSLTEPIDSSTAVGELMLQMLGAIAQFELALIRERVREGHAAARARGVIFGARRKFDYAKAAELKAQGLTWREIAAGVGAPCHHSVRNALARVKRGRQSLADPRSKPRSG